MVAPRLRQSQLSNIIHTHNSRASGNLTHGGVAHPHGLMSVMWIVVAAEVDDNDDDMYDGGAIHGFEILVQVGTYGSIPRKTLQTIHRRSCCISASSKRSLLYAMLHFHDQIIRSLTRSHTLHSSIQLSCTLVLVFVILVCCRVVATTKRMRAIRVFFLISHIYVLRRCFRAIPSLLIFPVNDSDRK